MKKILYIAAGMTMMLSSCSDYTPNGYEEGADLPVATTLEYTLGGAANHDITLDWTLPADKEVTGCILYRNATEIEKFDLNPTRAYTYTALGTPLGEEVVYTVKVTYDNNYISTGRSVVITLPDETFAGVTNLQSEVSGRSVTLSWTLPTQAYRTGVRVITNGDTDKAILLDKDATSYVLKAQPMDTPLTYSVEAVYDTYYYSPAVSVEKTIPFMESSMLFLLPNDAATYNDLQDDDELAAATWFAAQPNTKFIHPSEIADYDPAIYTVMWIMVDRVGQRQGWQNLPGDIGADATIEALKSYSLDGGAIYLSNMATQLTAPLGFVPENMEPSLFANGTGGVGSDIWTINPYLGWKFKDGADQGFYDRTDHAIFEGLTMLQRDPEDDYDSIPLIGPGQREDHNCIWDCNIYGKGSERDVIRNFEVTTNSLVLATWGHVKDHCVAGLVDFYSGPTHGRCVANGFAAYEWNQNSGANPYQDNVIKLTENILNYLK